MRATFEVLSADDRSAIHERSLHVLATTGMQVDTEVGRQILRAAGADVDDATCRVRFPADLVERSLASARRDLTLGGRRPGWSHPTGRGETSLVASGEALFALDPDTGDIRPGRHEDWVQGTKLIDALDEVGVYWYMIAEAISLDASDPDPADEVDYMTRVQRSFSKHVQDSSQHPEVMPWQLEILATVFGGREEVARVHPYSFLLTPISPLVIESKGADAALALSGWDIPVAIMPMPIAGATAPVSLAGTVLLGNSEVLGCICLLQAAEPGRPMIYAPIFATMNPRTGALASGAGHAMLGAACTEMADFYGLPSLSSGFDGDHVAPDQQNGYERAINALGAMLSRPDLLVGPGTLGGGMVWSPEQALIDREIFRMCGRVCEGIAVEDRLLDDVIDAVGPGGHFLAERSTRELIREGELFLPDLGQHDSPEAWVASGRPSLMVQAKDRVAALLEGHETVPLPEDIERELGQLASRARVALAG